MPSITAERLIWLHSNYYMCAGGRVGLPELHDRYREKFEDCCVNNLSRMVHRAFPEIGVKRERSKENWRKRKVFFIGLMERDLESESCRVIDFDSLAEVVPSGYFITARSQSSIEIAKYTGLVCNGSKVMLEIKIDRTGECDVHVMDTLIDCGFFAVEFSYSSISVFFAIMDTLRYCPGIENAELDPSQIENAIIQISKDGSKVAYSTNCLKVLPHSQLLSSRVCVQCKKLTQELKEPGEENLPEENPVCSASTQTYGTDDFMNLLKQKAPHLSNMQLSLIKSQIYNIPNSRSRSWDKMMIQLGLSIYTHSPLLLRHLNESGSLVLPAGRTLQRYRNSAKQNGGINENVRNLCWWCLDGKLPINNLDTKPPGSSFDVLGS